MSKSSDPPKSRREQRRDAIKQAAIEVFSERGYHAAKVSQIVEKVGVAQGTFYLYYESKQQLFGELLNDFLTLLVQTVADWEPGGIENRDELQHELTRVGLLVTQVIANNRGLAVIFFKEALAVAPEFDETIRDFYDTLGAMMTTFNEILFQRGLIQKMNFRLLAYTTIGGIERIIVEYVVSPSLTDVSIEELVEHLILQFMTGTSAPAPSMREGA